MYRVILLLSIALPLAACTEERVIYDNSPNAKFTAMMGGKGAGSDDVTGAWQVSGHTSSNKPVSAQAQRIADLIRGQIASPQPLPPDNPGNYRVTTSFDLTDQPNSPNGTVPANSGPTMGVPALNPPGAAGPNQPAGPPAGSP